MTEGKFRLETAIDKAYEEFIALNPEQQTPINVALLARKYTPQTSSQLLDCLNENKWMFFLEAQRGRMIIDSLIATATNYIEAVITEKYTKAVQESEMERAKKLATKAKLGIR